MSDSFTCPECGHDQSIADISGNPWVVYEEDGKETVVTCMGCNVELVITSSIVAWEFSTEINE